MTENLNRKRKSNSVPDLNSPEEQKVDKSDPGLGHDSEAKDAADLKHAETSTFEETINTPPVTQFSNIKPQTSLLRPPILAGLIAGLFGGALTALAVLTTPYLNSYLMGLNAPSRQNSIASEKIMAERMAALEAKLAAINSSGADVSKTDMTVSSLLSRMEVLEKNSLEAPSNNFDSVNRIAKLETSLNTFSKQQSGHSGAALMLATDALKYKFDRGGEFSGELKAVESWVDPSFNISALRQYAEAGLPAVSRISQRFADLSAAIVKDASPASEGLLGRVGAVASGLVKVRPSTEPNAVDTVSVVSRVQASLARGDIGPALDDLAKLEEPVLLKAAPVMRDLKARLEVEAAIRALKQNALQSLNVKKN